MTETEHTIKEVFDFIPETNLIEEYFYNHNGKYPVYSGQTVDEGVVAKINTYKQEGECITFTTYGVGAGKIFLRKGKFTIGRNCMGLMPKKEFKGKINLLWFLFNIQNKFYRHTIGEKKGQRSLNRKLVENIKFVLPPKPSQDKIAEKYKRLYSIKKLIEDKIDEIDRICYSTIDLSKEKTDEVIVNDIFDVEGGNSGLTEEVIYNNPPQTKEDEIEVFSSATQDITSMGIISSKTKIDGEEIKIFEEKGILIARNGYAGKMRYISNKKFTANDHAYILTLKEDWKNKVNYEWFIYQYQSLIRKMTTSKSDNATFNKEWLERTKVKLPDIDIQNKHMEKVKKLQDFKLSLLNEKIKSENLITFSVSI